MIIVDDDPAIREAIRSILAYSDANVIAEADNGRSAIEQAKALSPDVIILDVSMPVMDGFAAARELRESLPAVRVIFLSQHTEHPYVDEAFRIGACAYVAKTRASGDLLNALQAAISGAHYVSPAIRAQPASSS